MSLPGKFELYHDKEHTTSCIIMKSMSVPPADRFDNRDFPSRLLASKPKL